jgi:NAD-dependent SIR2 family protein deacetylase
MYQVPLEKAFENSQRADLMLALGSSLTVSPANQMPETTKQRGGKLVICNLQKTHLDNIADIRIFAKCDDVMNLVMKDLGTILPRALLFESN